MPASLDDEDAIEEGSLAERIAGDIVVHGVWLAWMSLPPAADEGRPPGGDVLAEGGGVRVMTLGFSVPASDGPILEGLDDVDVSGPADRPAPEIRAVDRVEGFVHQVSAVRGVSTAEVLRDWDARDIARSTTLPLRTARQAIEALAARSVEAAASTTGDASEKAPTKSDIRESRTS